MRTFRDFIRMSDELYEQAYNRDDIFLIIAIFQKLMIMLLMIKLENLFH